MAFVRKLGIVLVSFVLVTSFTLFLLMQASGETILNADFIIKTLEENKTYDTVYYSVASSAQGSAVGMTKDQLKSTIDSLLKNIIGTFTSQNADYSQYGQYLGNNKEAKQMLPWISVLSSAYNNRFLLLFLSALCLFLLILIQQALQDRVKAISKFFLSSSVSLFIYAGIIYLGFNSLVLPEINKIQANALTSAITQAVSQILNALATKLLIYAVICLALALVFFLFYYKLKK